MFGNDEDLAQELIDGRWTMDQDEFEKKYAALSDEARERVDEAIDGMNNEPIPGIGSGYGGDESIDVETAAEIWASSGFDEDQMFGYTEEELREALS